MGRTFWIMIGVIVLLILGFVAYSLWWPSENDGSTDKKVGKKETVEMQLKSKDCEIDKLYALLEARDSSIAQGQRTIALLIENCNGKKTGGSPMKAPVATKTGTTKVSSGNPAGGSLQITKTTEPEADYNVNINSTPKSKVRLEVNEVKFCVKLGEQYWPHLAVNLGKEFPEIVDNGIGGFDLFILPSGSVGSTGKPYGIADDGTYWIAASELTEWAQFTPYILGGKGFFVKATRSGDYWIAK